jgi:hypothetical protein
MFERYFYEVVEPIGNLSPGKFSPITGPESPATLCPDKKYHRIHSAEFAQAEGDLVGKRVDLNGVRYSVNMAGFHQFIGPWSRVHRHLEPKESELFFPLEGTGRTRVYTDDIEIRTTNLSGCLKPGQAAEAQKTLVKVRKTFLGSLLLLDTREESLALLVTHGKRTKMVLPTKTIRGYGHQTVSNRDLLNCVVKIEPLWG